MLSSWKRVPLVCVLKYKYISTIGTVLLSAVSRQEHIVKNCRTSFLD